MKIFCRNNLDKAVSPYLRQHKDNPVWWQEWSDKAVAGLDQKHSNCRRDLLTVSQALCQLEPFPGLRTQSKINAKAQAADQDPDFSKKIRTLFIKKIL